MPHVIIKAEKNSSKVQQIIVEYKAENVTKGLLKSIFLVY